VPANTGVTGPLVDPLVQAFAEVVSPAPGDHGGRFDV
jgi:hypothetical protein